MQHRAFSKTCAQTKRGCWSAEPRLPHEGLEVGLAVGVVVGIAVGLAVGLAVGEVVGPGVGGMQLLKVAPAVYADSAQKHP